MAHIGGIKKALKDYTTKGLIWLELKLKRELEVVLTQEELFGSKSLEKIGLCTAIERQLSFTRRH